MIGRVHAAAALAAMACIATFWIGTVAAELFVPGAVPAMKRLVVLGLWLLIPSIALAGATGFALARKRKGALAERKAKRMRFIVPNGLLVLVPAAVYLHAKAAAGEFDAAFWSMQSLELAAGLANLALMVLNARDGLRLAGGPRTRRACVELP